MAHLIIDVNERFISLTSSIEICPKCIGFTERLSHLAEQFLIQPAAMIRKTHQTPFIRPLEGFSVDIVGELWFSIIIRFSFESGQQFAVGLGSVEPESDSVSC